MIAPTLRVYHVTESTGANCFAHRLLWHFRRNGLRFQVLLQVAVEVFVSADGQGRTSISSNVAKSLRLSV